MKKIIVIGSSGAGKTSFLQALHGQDLEYKKTQSVEILHGAIDTPGEYIENKMLYRALIVSAVEADLLILLLDCTAAQSMFAPGFTSAMGKPAIGVVSKTDLAETLEQITSAEENLKMAGCRDLFQVSSLKGSGIDKIQEYLGM